MSIYLVCDVCGETITAPFHQVDGQTAHVLTKKWIIQEELILCSRRCLDEVPGMRTLVAPQRMKVPLGLHPHQEVWATRLAAAMGRVVQSGVGPLKAYVRPQIAVLRAFKAYVVMWQREQLPPDLTPEACGETPPGLPDVFAADDQRSHRP